MYIYISNIHAPYIIYCFRRVSTKIFATSISRGCSVTGPTPSINMGAKASDLSFHYEPHPKILSLEPLKPFTKPSNPTP